MPSENPLAGKAGWKNHLGIDPIQPEKWILPSHNLTNLVPTKHIMQLGLVPSNFLWPQLNVFHNKLECLIAVSHFLPCIPFSGESGAYPYVTSL